MKIYMYQANGPGLGSITLPPGTEIASLLPKDFPFQEMTADTSKSEDMPACLSLDGVDNPEEALRVCVFFALKVIQLVPSQHEGEKMVLHIDRGDVNCSVAVFQDAFVKLWVRILARAKMVNNALELRVT